MKRARLTAIVRDQMRLVLAAELPTIPEHLSVKLSNSLALAIAARMEEHETELHGSDTGTSVVPRTPAGVMQEEALGFIQTAFSEVRDMLRQHEISDSLSIEMRASGHTNLGEAEIQLRAHVGFDQSITGLDYTALLGELAHRVKFKKENQPRLIGG